MTAPRRVRVWVVVRRSDGQYVRDGDGVPLIWRTRGDCSEWARGWARPIRAWLTLDDPKEAP